ncbi:uncharacterized protein A4U43_C04F33740 [Asparagus officinalis]|uniref:COBRA-like protein n=1 Tax=Asparagus officinalis TaxID=4686 RepID=A0A5P1F647_ASPOF|nr:uncharacterized protein A4U43_C04F33740 [Asparagus officinalis]
MGTESYDPIDPNGDIEIKWDFQELRDDGGYTVLVNVYNNQLYRHVEKPGWALSWTWPSDEVIWDMRGAEATKQGNCSRFRGDNLPHSCEKNPVIVDLLPGAPYKMQTQNCCRGGVLSSMIQDGDRYMSSFQMSVGGEMKDGGPLRAKPFNFGFGVAGYTCSNVTVVPPTKFMTPNTRHQKQALMTWQVTCSYSQFRESLKPTCCVSLSTFYNDTIVSCPRCSCGCQGPPSTSQCARDGRLPDFLQLPHDDDNEPSDPVVMCTQHMCPIRVHWHLKTNYKEYWRVKVTITNFNLVKNYSDWNLVIQHPNLKSLVQVFSFNYKPLIEYGNINDTGMFWGIKYYNEMLLQEGEFGNVQSEMLLHKDPGSFTFQGGWGFPRSVLFNGHECVMPPPDTYPSLPRGSNAVSISGFRVSFGLLSLFVFSVWILL